MTCSTKLFNIKHAGALPHRGHNGEQQAALGTGQYPFHLTLLECQGLSVVPFFA
jgi:hypothetical protein